MPVFLTKFRKLPESQRNKIVSVYLILPSKSSPSPVRRRTQLGDLQSRTKHMLSHDVTTILTPLDDPRLDVMHRSTWFITRCRPCRRSFWRRVRIDIEEQERIRGLVVPEDAYLPDELCASQLALMLQSEVSCCQATRRAWAKITSVSTRTTGVATEIYVRTDERSRRFMLGEPLLVR
jgi:hypothetical protein